MTDMHSHMNDLKLLINGVLVPGALATDIVNPSTGTLLAQAPRASERQLDEAVAAAKFAFTSWSRSSHADRQAVLLSIAEAVDENLPELGRILTLEQGKPLQAAIGEAKRLAAAFRHFARVEPTEEVLKDDANRKIEVRRRSLGVVGAIAPWNVPLAMIGFKVPPALITGNTVVLKPAPTTPLSTLYFASLVAKLVPPGVLNVIADAGELGAQMTAHRDIAKITFTGSTATGRRVMASAAETLKRITLELGGNDPAIVLADVDPKVVAPKLFNAAFRNTGQLCIAVKRVYAHAAIYDALCDELAALAAKAKIGDGFDPDVEFGPLQNETQYNLVAGLIEEARTVGRVIAGGVETGRPGYFIRPTIVRDISDGTRLVDEEQFGPVLPIVKFTDLSDVVRRANTLPFGLGASIWSVDPEVGHSLAAQIESGTVWINHHGELAPDVPFAGAKTSGFGVELGQEGLREFTQLQVINSAKPAS